MVYYNQNGRAYNLDEKSFKGGGEGNVYDVIGQPSLVAKIYHANMLDAQITAKILAYADFFKSWDSNFRLYTVPPIEPLFDSNRKFAGYIMGKLVGDYVPLSSIYDADVGKDISYKNKIITAGNMCVITKLAHDNGVVIGDYNQKNIGVDPTGKVHLFDNDSFQFKANGKTHRCVVGVPEEMAPEIHKALKKEKADLKSVSAPVYNKYTDLYTMALHIFHLLMNGAHPFNSRIEASKLPPSQTVSSATISLLEASQKAIFIFAHPTVFRKPPKWAPAYEILSPELRNCFERAFVDGLNHPEKRPTPDEFYSALYRYSQELIEYPCGHFHHKSYTGSCEWCRISKK
ncbi:MAG: hypothetical protein IKB88_11845 [Clostridia bacterium]|nr:hypothetical protein [Clostridia bacterium]